MQRRHLLMLAGLIAADMALANSPLRAEGIDVDAILNDPAAPTAGNPKGDVTVVAYLDYNCPFCKKSAPDLERAAQEDGQIRIVYKDWPILTDASSYGARMALAANYQGGYRKVHDALMAIPGRGISQERMTEAIEASGVDLRRLEADLAAHRDEITALLRRNLEQAGALGLEGTPTYLIGPFRTSTLDYAGFKEAFAEARRRQAAK